MCYTVFLCGPARHFENAFARIANMKTLLNGLQLHALAVIEHVFLLGLFDPKSPNFPSLVSKPRCLAVGCYSSLAYLPNLYFCRLAVHTACCVALGAFIDQYVDSRIPTCTLIRRGLGFDRIS